MFGEVRSDLRRGHVTRHLRVLQPLRNLLLYLGFVDEARHFSHRGHPVPARPHSRSFFPSLPRDFVRRRRVMRRLTNIFLIGGLSVGAAYVITRPTGGQGFKPTAAARNALANASAEAASLPTDSKVALPVSASASATNVAATPSAGAAVGYNLAPGPHSVSEVSDIVLHDAKRNKDVHVRVFYPADPGKYPVIIFSHGAGGSQTCCESLTQHWASYGYVAIQPTHEDSAVLRRNGGEQDVRFMQAVRDALKKPALWESRPADISFMIDSLGVLQKRIANLQGKIDADRVGVAGHSMGSYTAEAIAGASIDLPGRNGATFTDPRVKAVLCLSPQGPGQFGLTEHSFDRISLPYLGVTGSLDSLGPVASPAWHKVPFDRSVEGDKFHVFIEGATHMSFITARTVSVKNASASEAILGYTNSAALAFWDAYLKGDAGAKSYLGSNSLEAESHNAVKLYRR